MVKRYVGDGVYAEMGPGGLTLTTENGVAVQNTIYLEPDVWTQLQAVVQNYVDEQGMKDDAGPELMQLCEEPEGGGRKCPHIGFAPRKAELSLCLLHEGVLAEYQGWRKCCVGCTAPFWEGELD